MGANPVAEPLRPGGLGKGVVAGAEHADEQLCLADLAGGGVLHRDGLPGVVNEQFLAGPVLLAQHHLLFSEPAPVEFAEAAVAIAVGMIGAVFFPEQLQSQVFMLLELGADRDPVRRWPAFPFQWRRGLRN